MDTRKNLIILGISLNLLHIILAIYILAKQGKLSEHIKAFLVVSIIVCLINVGISCYLM